MLNRPYIRVAVRQEVENRAEKNANGQFLDANTHQPIEGKYDLGHKTGHEFRTEVKQAEAENLTQAQFNDRMNNADLYQIEDPSSNRSHRFEAKAEAIQTTATATEEEAAAAQSTTLESESSTAAANTGATTEATSDAATSSSASASEDSGSGNNSNDDCDCDAL